LFVSGLEYSLPVAADAHNTPFVANLNAARNSFPQVVPCPLVLWVPEYVLTAIARGAPDFFSIRSGTYFFAATPGETNGTVNLLTGGDEPLAASLSLKEKEERISAIESLLADYEALPLSERDYHAELRLRHRLGSLMSGLGDYKAVRRQEQIMLDLARKLKDRAWEAVALGNLGNSYICESRLDKAEAVLSEALSVARDIGLRPSEGYILHQLGIIYELTNRDDQAEEAFSDALEIFHQVNDKIRAAWAMGSLAIIYQKQGRLEEALTKSEQSLDILREAGDRINEAKMLYNISLIYIEQGRRAEAEEMYQKSIAMLTEVGDTATLREILAELAEMKKDEGDLAGALELARQAVSVLETTDNESWTDYARELLADIENEINKEKTDSETQSQPDA
jgi:tetratricopeptide (TPR) repeat protein